MSVRGEQAARLCEFEKLESGGTAPKTGPLIGGVGSRRSRVKKGKIQEIDLTNYDIKNRILTGSTIEIRVQF